MVRSKPPSKKPQARGVDFKKYKRKLGRKLPPPKNTTNTEIKSKAIILPEQSVASDKAGLALSKKGLSLKELLQQTSHHNVRVRREALVGIREILLKNRVELEDHKLVVIEKLRERISDDDKTVRETLYQLFKSVILPGCKEDNQGALTSLIMAYIFSAMTHLTMDVRLMAFKFFDLVIQNFPPAFSSYAEKVLENYMDILQKIHFHIEDKSKLRMTLSGLVRCLSLLPSNKREVHFSGQKTAEKLVLHAFEMEVPENPTDNFVIIGKLKDLVQILLTCFDGLVSVVHSQRVLESHSFDCMLSILQSIDLVVRYYVYGTSDYQKDRHTIVSFPSSSGTWVQELPSSLLDKLFLVFPIRPMDYISEKEDQKYFILNAVIAQILFTFRQWIFQSLDLPIKFLDFLVDVLPKISVELSSKALYEKHLLSLVPFIPSLVATVDWSQKLALLEAFTTSFKNSYPDSAMKMACLEAVREMLASEEQILYSDVGDVEIRDYQRHWISETGMLLNSLGSGHPSKSQKVLHFMVRLGQAGLRNNDLVDEYDKLQDEFQKFYCICTEKGDRCYGPFMALPEDCQITSICCLFYFDSLKGDLLASLALCCLSHSLKPSILAQIIDVVRTSYGAGHINIADYISFCITFLSQYEVIGEGTCTTMERETVLSCQKNFRSATGVFLTSLTQMGDEPLLLQIMENFVLDIISQKLSLENTCALLRLLVQVDSKPTKLSVKSIIKLVDIVLGYMIDVALLCPDHDTEHIGVESPCSCRYYLVPCIHLFERSSVLTKHLLTKTRSFIAESCGPRKIKAVVCFLSMMSMDPKTRRVLFPYKAEIHNIQSLLLVQSSEMGNLNIEQQRAVEAAVESLKNVIRFISSSDDN